MKNLTRGFFVVAVLASRIVAAETATTAADWPLTEMGVGPIQIGMPYAAARSAAGSAGTLVEKTRKSEGEIIHVSELLDGRKSLLIMEASDDKLWRLTVESPQFKTAHNIAVGTSLKDLQKVTPHLTIAHAEGNGSCAITPDMGLSFCFTQTAPKPTDTIARILVLGSGE